MSRKSDVALPTIMNVFLMIAVILVASSFLLKAFGIDILGFLKNLFGGMFLKPQKILFIKIDPGSTPQIHQFYLTSDKYHVAEPYGILTARYVSRFMPLELPEKNCVIYTVDENSGGLDERDEGYYYYVKSGAIIQEGCGNNLGSCLKDYIVNSGCVAKSAAYLCGTLDLELSPAECSKVAGEFVFANCGCDVIMSARCDEKDVDERKVEQQSFLDKADFVKECKNERETKCNLLVPDLYRIKYGLLCKDGIWQVCKEDNLKSTGGDCYQDGEYFKWRTGKPTLILSTNKEVYLPVDTEIQLKATTSTSPTGELFNIEVVPPSTKPKCTIFQGSDSCEILYNLPTVSGPIEFKATAYKSGAAFIIGEKIAETSKKVDVDLWTEGTVSWTGKNVGISLSDDKKIGDYSIRGFITSGGEISMTYQFIQPIPINSIQSIKFYIKANSDSNGRIYITDENKKTYYAEYKIDGYAELKIGEDFSLIELKRSDFQPTGFIGGIDWNKIASIEFYAKGNDLRNIVVDYLHIYPPPEPTFKLAKDSSLPTMPTSEEES